MSNTDLTWSDLKVQFQRTWNSLKEDEIEKTHGNKEELIKLIQNRYGLPHAQASAEVSELLNGFSADIEELPASEETRKIENDDKPEYPNKLYEEDLPPDIKLELEE